MSRRSTCSCRLSWSQVKPYGEGRPYVQATRSQAKAWLSRPAVGALNEALQRKFREIA